VVVYFTRSCWYLCADLAAKYPKFSGSGYIAFPVLRGADRAFDVTVELRPDVLSGLLLFSAAHPDAQSDFFSVALQRERIELRYVVYTVSGKKILTPIVLLCVIAKSQPNETRICMKFSGKVGNGPVNK